ncbi:MAG: hypothetical protein AAB618_02355 [Patescibacteria group bacterium]
MIRIISTAALASVLALSATPILADDGFFASNTHLLVGEEKAITAEYAWADGSFSGFGFIDKSLNSDFVITDNEVRAKVAGPFYVNGELGYNRFGGTMGKIGVGVNIAGLPAVRDHFTYLRVYAQHTVFGPDAKRIIGASWGTKDLRLTKGVSVYASGFADIKQDAPDVVQPQVWLKFDNSLVEVGTEVSIFGKETSVMAALKLKL